MAGTDNPFGNVKLIYPARVVMKAITFSTFTEREHKSAINGVLKKLKLEASEWKIKSSSSGKYVSYSFTVEISDKIQMDKMYTLLNSLEVVKMLL